MSGRAKIMALLMMSPLVLLGVTSIPSGGLDILNSSRQAVIRFFDTGNATFNGDVTANAFIGDGSGLTGISGAGDVVGPGSSTDNALVRFDLTTGKLIQDSSATLSDAGTLTATAFVGDGSGLTGVSGSGDVVGPGSSTDNSIPRYDSTTGKLIQGSGVIIDDSNNITGISSLTATSGLKSGSSGAASLRTVDIESAASQRQALRYIIAGDTRWSVENNGGASDAYQIRRYTGGAGGSFQDNPLSISNSTGAITLTVDLPVTEGGTGVSSFTDGGVVIGNAAGALQVTTAGTSGQVLVSNGAGVDPTFQTFTQNATHTGEATGATALTLSNTAITNRSTVTAATGDLMLLADISNSNALIKAPISDIYPLITGLTDAQVSDTLTASIFRGSGTTSDAIDLATAEAAGTLPVTKGGLGATSFTDGGVMIGNAAGVIQVTTAGTSGQVLTSNGAGVDPTFQALPVTATSTTTFTNKRITKRAGTVASSATPTINTDNVDYFSISALAVNITSMSSGLSGTPVVGDTLWVEINGTATRTITWGASFEDGPVALPTTTVGTTRLDVFFIRNTNTNKWRCMAAG